MDVTLVRASILQLPTAHRVGAVVYDGAADLRLWPGPSLDRDLNEAYGNNLGEVLTLERERLGGEWLPLGGIARVHPGRLHCDMLLWAASRAPEPGTSREPAPTIGLIETIVINALTYLAERSVVRVAFPALGAGPDERPPAERVAAIVRMAHRYEDECFAGGRRPGIEEVLVCEGSATVLADARRLVKSLARTAVEPSSGVGDAAKAKRQPRVATKISGGSGTGRGRAKAPRLDPLELEQARRSAQNYDRTRTYGRGDWLQHARFGMGQVQEVTAEGAIVVLFEDGSQKKMVHSRP